MEKAQEKTTKPIKIKLHRQDKDTEDRFRRIHQETAKEKAEEEPVETLQRRQWKHDREKHDREKQGEGSFGSSVVWFLPTI